MTTLEEYLPSYLALLPLSLRKEILWRLPMADVCKLEDIEFVKGIKTEDYWSSTFSEDSNTVAVNKKLTLHFRCRTARFI